jgi:hypothetical protein
MLAPQRRNSGAESQLFGRIEQDPDHRPVQGPVNLTIRVRDACQSTLR